jgi:hypothetical protein
MIRVLGALAVTVVLAGCAEGPNGPVASDERVAAEAYRHPGPATFTLITMINNTSESGAHTALMVNGSQRVIFDPAGSFYNDAVPQQDDVLFGITPRVFAAYKSAHARTAFHVVTQEIEVTPQQAEIALRLIKANGSVGPAQCTNSTSSMLRQIPGFEDIKGTWFPSRLMEQFETRAGVVTDRYYEDDEGTIVDGVAKVEL